MARVLIVEDDEGMAQFLQESLEQFGHQVVDQVTTGAAAIALLSQTEVDLILMDIQLEGSPDGIATAAQLRDRNLHIPIIFLTAYTASDTLQRAIATHPFGYLVKPVREIELYSMVTIALYRHQLERQLSQAEQQLSTTLASLADGAIATDSNGRITFMNPMAEVLTGWLAADSLGKPLSQVLPLINPTTGEPLDNPIQRAVEAGEFVSLPDICLLRTKDGQERPISDAAAPIRNASGDIIGGVLVFQDATKQRQAEMRSREFRALVENSPDVIARFDQNLRYLYINPSMEKATGIPSQAFIGRTNSDLFMPADVVLPWHFALTQALETGQEQSTEFDLITADGVRSYQVRIVPELNAEHEVESLLSVARDVTEYKRAEAQLRDQAEREKIVSMITQRIHRSLDLDEILVPAVRDIRQWLKTDRVVVYQFDPDWSGRVIVESVDPRWPSMSGHRIYDPCLRLESCILPYQQGEVGNTPDIHAAGFSDCYVELLDRYAVQANLIVPILLGTRLWGLLAVQHCEAPRQWHDQEIDLLRQIAAQMAIAIQQSNLYQQVQQLNASLEQQVRDRTFELEQAVAYEATLKRITDRIRDSFDEDQILQTVVAELAIAVNAETCDVSLYDLEARTSTICYEYTTSISAFQGRCVQMADFRDGYRQLLQGQDFQFCCLPQSADEPRFARLACPIMDDQGALGDLWLLKASDDFFPAAQIRLVQQVANQCAIALRQSRLYQAVQTQVAELEQLNRLKDDFLSTVSHELRTPMASIKMALHMLRIVLEPTGLLTDESGAAQRYFRILQDECQRETNLINDLLNLSQLERGTRRLTVSTVHLQTWLLPMVQPFHDRCQQQQQTLTISYARSLPPLQTDVSYLERILTELLTNACKYTPPHEHIQVIVQSSDTHVLIQVRNSGSEIPPQELGRIFEKFYRVPRSDRWQHGGTGLGLALAQRMVIDLHGSIEVSSNAEWTTFTVQLPWTLTPADA